MKRILVALAAAVMIITLAACGDSAPAATPAPAGPAYTPYTPQVTAEQQYLDQVHSSGVPAPDATLLSIAQSTCGLFTAYGVPTGFQKIVQAAIDSGISSQQAGFISGSAVKFICPEHTEALRAYISQYQ